jgi:hypothetical protein
MMFVVPLLLHVGAGLAVTTWGPEIIKSEPSPAIELHRIGFLKTSSIYPGLHETLYTLSMGVNCCGEETTGRVSPPGTVLPQISNSVFPSAPSFMVSVKVPNPSGWSRVSVNEGVPNWLLQSVGVALTILTPPVIEKSDPSAERELHFTSLFKRTRILVLSQLKLADDKCGSIASVIIAVPPVNVNW